MVPLTPGSATDVMARIVFDQVSQQVGQPIVIENRPGAGNSIGMNAVAKADPDGYTILANSSSHTVSARGARDDAARHRERSLRDHPARQHAGVILFNPKKGYKKLSDFVDWAKANPGKANYSSAGAGNSSHLNGELFRLAGRLRRGAPAVQGRAGGNDRGDRRALRFLLLAAGQRAAADEGRPVAGARGQQLAARASALPDIPTVAEAGYPNSEYNFWAGVFVPAKTPAPIKQKLYAEIVKALDAPDACATS